MKYPTGIGELKLNWLSPMLSEADFRLFILLIKKEQEWLLFSTHSLENKAIWDSELSDFSSYHKWSISFITLWSLNPQAEVLLHKISLLETNKTRHAQNAKQIQTSQQKASMNFFLLIWALPVELLPIVSLPADAIFIQFVHSQAQVLYLKAEQNKTQAKRPNSQ